MTTNRPEKEQSDLGLPRDSNQLRAYSERWVELYELEARAIRAVLAGLVRDIQHIGSTAIPGIAAKPILDIAIGIDRLDRFTECIEPLNSLGYEHAYSGRGGSRRGIRQGSSSHASSACRRV